MTFFFKCNWLVTQQLGEISQDKNNVTGHGHLTLLFISKTARGNDTMFTGKITQH